MTQKQIIISFIADQPGEGWVLAYKLAGKDTAYGFIGSEAARRLRELREEGKVESRQRGRFEEYRIARPTTEPSQHSPEPTPPNPPKPTGVFCRVCKQDLMGDHSACVNARPVFGKP